MICSYTTKKRLLEIVVMPIAVASFGIVGACSANSIAEKFNKASLLKEFSESLLNGSAGKKAIAKMALKDYLSKEEMDEVNRITVQSFQATLIKNLEDKDELKIRETSAIFLEMYPQAFSRLIKTKDSTQEDDPLSRALIEKLNENPKYSDLLQKSTRKPVSK